MEGVDADLFPFEDPNKQNLVAEVSTKVSRLNEILDCITFSKCQVVYLYK